MHSCMCGGDVICSLCVDIERMFGVIWTSVMFRFVYLSICFFIQYGLIVWFLRFFVVTTHVDFLVSCFGCSVFSIGGVYYWVVSPFYSGSVHSTFRNFARVTDVCEKCIVSSADIICSLCVDIGEIFLVLFVQELFSVC